MMAPTFHILNRLAYPCRICKRNNLNDELCRVCLAAEQAALDPHIPAFLYGRFLYIPYPQGMEKDVLEFLQFWFALRHLNMDSYTSTIPFLPEGLKGWKEMY